MQSSASYRANLISHTDVMNATRNLKATAAMNVSILKEATIVIVQMDS